MSAAFELTAAAGDLAHCCDAVGLLMRLEPEVVRGPYMAEGLLALLAAIHQRLDMARDAVQASAQQLALLDLA